MSNNRISWLNNTVCNTPAPQKRTGRTPGRGAAAPSIPPRAYQGKDSMDADELMMAQPGMMMQRDILQRGMTTQQLQQGTVQQPQQGMTQQGMTRQGPPTMTEPYYIPNYLARNIGKNVRAEFVVGTSQFMDKSGILREVGVNYFVLEDYISHALIMCDLYSVKFVTIL